jgi:hypothetical protein
MGGRVLTICLALGLAFASAAGAHDLPDVAVSPSAAAAAVGKSAERLPGGLFRVEPAQGPPVLTHGPDAAMDYLPAPRVAEAPRPPVCGSEYVQHVLVGRLAGLPDRAGAAADARRALARVNGMLAREAVASGGASADFRVACEPSGQVRVDSFVAASPRFEDIVDGARAAGFNRPDVNYTIFFDGPAVGDFCGMASYVADARPTADNQNNDGGAYAVTYQPCWDSPALLHEIAHNQGAVQPAAPNSTGTGGHCNQFLDVVCVAPDGGDRNQVPTLACAGTARFDCGFDDYFDAAPEAGEYLASHWNLGSPANRFVEFGGAAPAAPDEAACRARSCATRLSLGGSTSAALGAGGQAQFELEVPRGTDELRIAVSPAQALRLQVRRGSLPRGRPDSCGLPVCRIDAPRKGSWFVAIDARHGTTVGELGFEIRASAAR